MVAVNSANDLKVYPLLSTRSKRAIRRKNRGWGHSYDYEPRQALVERLMVELNMTEDEVLEQIISERLFFLKYPQYY